MSINGNESNWLRNGTIDKMMKMSLNVDKELIGGGNYEGGSEMRDLDRYKKVCHSLVLQYEKPITLTQLLVDFRESEGFDLPFRRLGYTSADEFVCDLGSDVVRVRAFEGSDEKLLYPANNDATQHIRKFIAEQRQGGKDRDGQYTKVKIPNINGQHQRRYHHCNHDQIQQQKLQQQKKQQNKVQMKPFPNAHYLGIKNETMMNANADECDNFIIHDLPVEVYEKKKHKKIHHQRSVEPKHLEVTGPFLPITERDKINEMMKKYPDGLQVISFEKLYKEKYEDDFPYEKCRFKDIVTCLLSISEIVRVEFINKTWIVKPAIKQTNTLPSTRNDKPLNGKCHRKPDEAHKTSWNPTSIDDFLFTNPTSDYESDASGKTQRTSELKVEKQSNDLLLNGLKIDGFVPTQVVKRQIKLNRNVNKDESNLNDENVTLPKSELTSKSNNDTLSNVESNSILDPQPVCNDEIIGCSSNNDSPSNIETRSVPVVIPDLEFACADQGIGSSSISPDATSSTTPFQLVDVDNESIIKSSSTECMGKDLDEMPDGAIRNLRKILEANPIGIPASEFMDEYQRVNGVQMKCTQWGFSSPIEMYHSLPSIFTLLPPDRSNEILFPGSGDDWIIIDSRYKKQIMETKETKEKSDFQETDDPVTKTLFKLPIEDKYKYGILRIVIASPHRLYLKEFADVFHINFQEELNVRRWGYESLTEFFQDLSKEIPIELMHLKPTDTEPVIVRKPLQFYEEWLSELAHEKRFEHLALMAEVPNDIVLPGETYHDFIMPEAALDPYYRYVYVKISTCVHPKNFKVHLYGSEHCDILKQIEDSLHEIYSRCSETELSVPDVYINPEFVCAAWFDDGEDKFWTRGKITKIRDDGKIVVLYVDYGGVGILEKTQIKLLKNIFLQIPIQAQRLSLYGIAPIDEKWTRDAKNALLNFSDENLWLSCMVVRNVEKYKKYDVILLKQEQEGKFTCINEYLVAEGHALFTKEGANVLAGIVGLDIEKYTNKIKEKIAKDATGDVNDQVTEEMENNLD